MCHIIQYPPCEIERSFLHLGSIFVPVSRNIRQSGLERAASAVLEPVPLFFCLRAQGLWVHAILEKRQRCRPASLNTNSPRLPRWGRDGRGEYCLWSSTPRPGQLLKNEGRLRNPDTETTRAPRIQPQAPTRHDLIAHVDAFLQQNHGTGLDLFVCLLFARFYHPVRYMQRWPIKKKT